MPQQYDPNEQVTLSFTAPAQIWNRFMAHTQTGPYEVVALFIMQFARQTQSDLPRPAGNGADAPVDDVAPSADA